MSDANWKANKEFIDSQISNMKLMLENEDATKKLNKLLNDLYAENARLQNQVSDITSEWTEVCADNARLREALELIATSVRSDGTYNRSREACEQLAREALKGGE